MQRILGRNDIQALLEEVDSLSKRLAALEIVDQNQQTQAIVPALVLLSDKLNGHIKAHPNRDEAHSLSITILGDKVSTKAKKEVAITTANATDLATAITLLNEIKTKLNSMNS